ncbi:translation initiation factor IF-2 isoform X1 [Oryza brachyantha]|uniref:translation initiation factor IF-2 isoform X1 n=1 Tax=Oryza brachyantha TaxID=4533 RepID=UPI001AD98E88|nr:translation initiation factor IF-2 isoform X1 [Oryza brachyantha]XP_015696097.2 translation initiation factor IF-2 isoform X1 [Oryza brachyantha]
MDYGRKPPSLLELCIRTTMDNLRYVDNVDGVEMNLLERILPHCKLEDLTRIESNTKMDLSPITNKLWKLFYRRQFGEDCVNGVIKRMKTSGARYTWKELFEAKTEKQKEFEDKMGQRLAEKYELAKAERQSKQIKICTKVPPSSKRSFWGGSGPSNLSSYKSPMLKKARMEVNSHAKMQAAIQRNTIARTSQPVRMTSAHAQPMKTTTIHRPNSTITVTKPIGLNRPLQSNKPTGLNRPLQSNKPTGLNRPLMSSKPTGLNRPLQSNKPTGLNRPLQSNKPTGLNRPLMSSKPTGLNRPMQSNKPTGQNRPLQSNRPKF